MSLFLGNISAHIHREELERVFRRFGRCDVQLKEGYGFAIYEVPENAERALRTLRGKQICGENIALDWSRKQPGDFQRFSGPRRFNGPYHGRNFRDKDNVDRMKGPRPYRNFPMQRGRRPLFGHRGHHFDRMDYTREEVNNLGEERGPNFKERMVHKDDHTEANTARNDKWGEHGNGSSDAHAIDNEAEFERYVPSRGLEKRDNNEHNQVTGSDSSPLNASSSDKSRKEYSSDAEHKQLDDSKPQQTCFICGLAGHRMRDCPRVDRPRHDRLERRDSERDYMPRNERGQKRKRSISWSGPDAGKDSVLLRPLSKDGKGSKSQKSRKMHRKEGSPENMKDHHHKLGREDRRKKRKRREIGDSKKASRKSNRRSRSSNLQSDSFASSSRSKSCSSRSVSGISSRSRSRSPSSRSCSESSSPKTISSFSKSRSSRLRSLSRSLSVSLEHKSSPKDVNAFNDASINSNMMHASNPESKVAANSNSELQDIYKDKNAYISCKVDVDTYEEQHIGDDCEEERFFRLNTGDREKEEKEEKESSMDMSEKVSFSSAKSLDNLGENNYNEAQSGSSPHFRVGCQEFRYTRMSVQEMCRALKNYGLAAPEESEHGLSVGTYFGAGRLWPWEMIYYRRLKRGPITTENYARRIEQNKEFGIIDKFIRSSSGWGEDGQSDA